MLQPIFTDVNEAHLMLTESICNDTNKKKKNWVDTIFYYCTCCCKSKQNEKCDVVGIIIKPEPQMIIDTGIGAIPPDEFELKLKVLQNLRDEQDREFRYVPDNSSFDEFNKRRNNEINEQFEQLQ